MKIRYLRILALSFMVVGISIMGVSLVVMGRLIFLDKAPSSEAYFLGFNVVIIGLITSIWYRYLVSCEENPWK